MTSLDAQSTGRQCRLVVADDHAIMRDGLVALLGNEPDIEVVGTAEDGRAAIEAVGEHEPDVVLMDLSMPGTDGTRALAEIKRRYPDTRVVVLTLHRDNAHIHAALQAGADAYVLKDDGRREVLAAVRSVAAGKRYISPAIAGTVMRGYLHSSAETLTEAKPSWERLTSREREVLKLVAEGHKTREIAEYLSLSPKTVDKHRARMMRKLDLDSVSAVTAYAIENGFLS